MSVIMGYQPAITTQGNMVNYEDKNEQTDNNIDFHFEEFFMHSDMLPIGHGYSIGGALGYMFNSSLGFEVMLNKTIELQKSIIRYYTNSVVVTANQTQYNQTYTISSYAGEMLKLAPSLIITTGKYGLNAYTKFGPMMGIGRVLYANESKTTSLPSEYRRWEYYDGLAWGGYLGLGIMVNLTPGLILFSGADLTYLQYKPLKGRLIEATTEGRDILGTFNPYDRQIDFVESYYINPTGIQYWAPAKQNTVCYTFSSVSWRIGLSLGF